MKTAPVRRATFGDLGGDAPFPQLVSMQRRVVAAVALPARRRSGARPPRSLKGVSTRYVTSWVDM